MIAERENLRKSLFSRTVAAALLIGGLATVSFGLPAMAEDLSTQQIIDGLKMHKTRSLNLADRPAVNSDDLAFINRVRGQTRSLSFDDREHMAAIAPTRPKIDLEINFDYDSAAVNARSEPQLNNLGKALTSGELAGSVFMLGGHTDARGSDGYNQSLSERRAETVKRFLMDNYHIAITNLVSAGYGKKGLKNATDPFAAENRRVEIVNVEERQQASQ
jgi:outer membrane protein OmpA-like peptidoglycan-associated protein